MEPDSIPITREPEANDRWGTLLAILIALVTVAGALVAWRSSVAADGAGDADFAGLRATLNAEETRALNSVNAYEHYGAFTTYKRYAELGDLLAEDAALAPEEEAERLDRQRAEAQDLATANQSLFPNRFLSREGGYSLQRQLGELWADAGRERDLKPEPQYAEAERLLQKSNQLLVALTVLGVALVAYTLAEAGGARLRMLLLAVGTLLAVVGIGFALYLELLA